MRAGSVVVREVTAQQASEAPLVEHVDVIEAFPSNRADDALGEGILPGRPRGDEELGQPQAFHPPYEHVAVDRIPIGSKYLGAVSSGKLSTSWWAVQAAVGWSVTLTWTSSRRWCRRIKNPKSKRKVSVGTTKKSTATTSRRCASRKVRHVGDGRGEGRCMYLATVSSASS
jgi:hypothetical protein